AAGDGVHEMAFGRITFSERHVIAALHHACATAFAQQAFHGHGNVQRWIRIVGMQGGEQPRPARAQDEYVGGDDVEILHQFAPNEARTASRRLCTSLLTSSYKELPWLSMATSSGPKSRMRNFHSDSGFRSSRSTSSICSIQVVSNAAVPPTMPRYTP